MAEKQQETNQENQVEGNLPSSDDMSFLDNSPTTTTSQDNSGALYPNTSRKKESHPNCRGRSLVAGVWYWVSGWNNLSASGSGRYISLSYTEMTVEDIEKYILNKPEQKSEAAPKTPTPASVVEPEEVF